MTWVYSHVNENDAEHLKHLPTATSVAKNWLELFQEEATKLLSENIWGKTTREDRHTIKRFSSLLAFNVLYLQIHEL